MLEPFPQILRAQKQILLKFDVSLGVHVNLQNREVQPWPCGDGSLWAGGA